MHIFSKKSLIRLGLFALVVLIIVYFEIRLENNNQRINSAISNAVLSQNAYNNYSRRIIEEKVTKREFLEYLDSKFKLIELFSKNTYLYDLYFIGVGNIQMQEYMKERHSQIKSIIELMLKNIHFMQLNPEDFEYKINNIDHFLSADIEFRNKFPDFVKRNSLKVEKIMKNYGKKHIVLYPYQKNN